jgi:hypothetical protein
MTRFNVPPPAHALLIDPRSGLMTPEWYRFFEQLGDATGGDTALASNVAEATEAALSAQLSGGGAAESGQRLADIESWHATILAPADDPTQRLADLDGRIGATACRVAEAEQKIHDLEGLIAAGPAAAETDALERARSLGYRIAAAEVATLIAGTVTVSIAAVEADSLIFLTVQVPGGTAGLLSVGTITAGTSFVINSASGSDTSDVGWLLLNVIR